MNFKKLIYQAVNSTYHDFKMLNGLKFYKNYKTFIKNNQIISNYSQILELLKVIDNLLSQETGFENNLEKLQDSFLSCLEIMVTLDKYSDLVTVNKNYLNNFVVRLYGKYHQQFLEFKTPQLTNWITTTFNEGTELNNLNEYLKTYKELSEIIKVSFLELSIEDNYEKKAFFWDLEKHLPILQLLINLTNMAINQGEK
ncbi:hypothetical protein [Mesoplasma seiffertii]|uniref:hypothetical protein n=1 Tax=Mesoplasma seiffertii TaxID=28224 RepID=UPI00047CFF1B|nr:hypothetical protein [Mesoplasma seiffertii]